MLRSAGGGDDDDEVVPGVDGDIVLLHKASHLRVRADIIGHARINM